MLLAAASTVRISLSSDVVVRRGRTTVVADVGAGQLLPVGTKLIGKASAGYDGVVAIRFDRVVLPSGVSIKARAEALDTSTGSPDLLGSVTGGSVARSQPSVARSVGTTTAERLATGVLGGGIAGSAARQAAAESGRARGSARIRTPQVVTLASESSLQALFLREVRVPANGG